MFNSQSKSLKFFKSLKPYYFLSYLHEDINLHKNSLSIDK